MKFSDNETNFLSVLRKRIYTAHQFKLSFLGVFLLASCLPSTQAPILPFSSSVATSSIIATSPTITSSVKVPSLISADPLPNNEQTIAVPNDPNIQNKALTQEPVVLSPESNISQSLFGSGSSNGSSIESKISAFVITDVILVSTGKSLSSNSSEEALKPVFEKTNNLELSIKGSFNASELNLDRLKFTYIPGLLHLSLGETELPYRITLNESILLTPVYVSPQEIRVVLNTEAITDLFLNGYQTLQVVANSEVAKKQIRVESTQQPSISLSPSIQKVEIITETSPAQLKITGKNFPIQPNLNYLEVNGKSLRPMQTAVREIDGQLVWEHWATFDEQDINSLPENEKYALFYSSPFGVSISEFERGL